ncbi:unnamed protein product (mitochondrion) [Plasmodiophora brassicae]|uniref:Calmodulin n=1 Tax=Plasmodiophora brassicae TaxID=37360 RepID=A0A0G4IXK4_PLABS|nr:hypothetical protein PBRA_007583 [Plasmodiophora brassicae]SPR02063.1 unnamed protein product [Plasmodiophora brassicae]
MAQAAQFLRLSAQEVALFERLFALVDDHNVGEVTGAQVSGLFTTSKLPRPTLAAIWNIASQGKPGKLDKDGFFVGCRLIAIAQASLPVTQESLVTHRDVPLPLFHGPAMQYYPGQAQRPASQPANVQQQQQAYQQQQMQMQMAQQQQQLAHQQQQQQQQQQQGQLQQAAQPQPPPAMYSGQPALKQPSDALWEITPEKRETYLKYFDQADADKDGFVNGKEAKSFFTMSKLSSVVLRDIWLLSDIDQDNKLNREEFTIAMHLTMTVRMSGVPVPQKLPEPLAQYHRQMLMASQVSQQSNGIPIGAVGISPVQQQMAPQQQQLVAQVPQPQHVPQPQPVPPSAPLHIDNSMPSMMSQLSLDMLQPSAPKAPTEPLPEQVAARAEYHRRLDSARAQIEEQKAAAQGYQTRLPDYEEENENLRKQVEAAEASLAQMVEQRKAKQAAFDQVRQDIAVAKAEIEKIQGLITAEAAAMKECAEKTVKGLRELDALRAERDQLQRTTDDLKQQVQDKELAVVCLEQNIEETLKQIDHIKEVSSYQVQILNRLALDYDQRDQQATQARADLAAAKVNLDRLKAAAAATGAAASASPPATGDRGTTSSPPPPPSRSAPVSPAKPPVTWSPPPPAAAAAATSGTSALSLPDDFTFPELTDADFSAPNSGNSMKSAPITMANALAEPAARLPPATAPPFEFGAAAPPVSGFEFPSDADPWDVPAPASHNASDDFSAKTYDVNPFEEAGWDVSHKAPASEAGKVDEPAKNRSPPPAAADPAADVWPEFEPPPASSATDWAQF